MLHNVGGFFVCQTMTLENAHINSFFLNFAAKGNLILWDIKRIPESRARIDKSY